jgi:hypothetical protein
MSGILVDCIHCDGKGKVPCKCNNRQLTVVQELNRSLRWDDRGVYIARCKHCNQLWKVYSKHWVIDSFEDLWLRPGTSRGEYAFTIDEALPHLEPTDLFHWPYVELLKRIPFEKLVELRHAAERALGLVTPCQDR